jgi:hypothetical protein
MGLYKILKILAIVLSVAGIAFFAMIWSAGDKTIEETLANGGNVASIDWLMYVAYIMLAVVVLFVLVFTLKGIFEGNIKKTLGTVVAFLIVVGIGYALSTGTDANNLPMVDGKHITESASHWVGAGLKTFYILIVLAIASMVWSSIRKYSN